VINAVENKTFARERAVAEIKRLSSARLNVASYGLTPREEEIVKLVARSIHKGDLGQPLYLRAHGPQPPEERHRENGGEQPEGAGPARLLRRSAAGSAR